MQPVNPYANPYLEGRAFTPFREYTPFDTQALPFGNTLPGHLGYSILGGYLASRSELGWGNSALYGDTLRAAEARRQSELYQSAVQQEARASHEQMRMALRAAQEAAGRQYTPEMDTALQSMIDSPGGGFGLSILGRMMPGLGFDRIQSVDGLTQAFAAQIDPFTGRAGGSKEATLAAISQVNERLFGDSSRANTYGLSGNEIGQLAFGLSQRGALPGQQSVGANATPGQDATQVEALGDRVASVLEDRSQAIAAIKDLVDPSGKAGKTVEELLHHMEQLADTTNKMSGREAANLINRISAMRNQYKFSMDDLASARSAGEIVVARHGMEHLGLGAGVGEAGLVQSATARAIGAFDEAVYGIPTEERFRQQSQEDVAIALRSRGVRNVASLRRLNELSDGALNDTAIGAELARLERGESVQDKDLLLMSPAALAQRVSQETDGRFSTSEAMTAINQTEAVNEYIFRNREESLRLAENLRAEDSREIYARGVGRSIRNRFAAAGFSGEEIEQFASQLSDSTYSLSPDKLANQTEFSEAAVAPVVAEIKRRAAAGDEKAKQLLADGEEQLTDRLQIAVASGQQNIADRSQLPFAYDFAISSDASVRTRRRVRARTEVAGYAIQLLQADSPEAGLVGVTQGIIEAGRNGRAYDLERFARDAFSGAGEGAQREKVSGLIETLDTEIAELEKLDEQATKLAEEGGLSREEALKQAGVEDQLAVIRSYRDELENLAAIDKQDKKPDEQRAKETEEIVKQIQQIAAPGEDRDKAIEEFRRARGQDTEQAGGLPTTVSDPAKAAADEVVKAIGLTRAENSPAKQQLAVQPETANLFMEIGISGTERNLDRIDEEQRIWSEVRQRANKTGSEGIPLHELQKLDPRIKDQVARKGSWAGSFGDAFVSLAQVGLPWSPDDESQLDLQHLRMRSLHGEFGFKAQQATIEQEFGVDIAELANARNAAETSSTSIESRVEAAAKRAAESVSVENMNLTLHNATIELSTGDTLTGVEGNVVGASRVSASAS